MARSKGVPLPVTPKVHAPSRGASCILSNPKDGTSEFDGLCFGLIIEDIGCTHDSAHERIDSTCGIAFFCADTAFVFITHFDNFCTLLFCNYMHGSPLQCTAFLWALLKKSSKVRQRGWLIVTLDFTLQWVLKIQLDMDNMWQQEQEMMSLMYTDVIYLISFHHVSPLFSVFAQQQVTYNSNTGASELSRRLLGWPVS